MKVQTFDTLALKCQLHGVAVEWPYNGRIVLTLPDAQVVVKRTVTEAIAYVRAELSTLPLVNAYGVTPARG